MSQTFVAKTGHPILQSSILLGKPWFNIDQLFNNQLIFNRRYAVLETPCSLIVCIVLICMRYITHSNSCYSLHSFTLKYWIITNLCILSRTFIYIFSLFPVNASRVCLDDGTWDTHTDYTQCMILQPQVRDTELRKNTILCYYCRLLNW